MGNAIIFKSNATYVCPELKVRYYKPFKGKFIRNFGLVTAVSYWTSKLSDTRDQRITPELGLTIRRLYNITYGYNIPLSNNKLSFISEHRISILFTVF